MTLEEFSKKEQEILDKMQNQGRQVSETGLVSKVPQEGTMTGYLVYLTFPEQSAIHIARTSKQINRALSGRSVIYDLDSIHQTIADFKVGTSDIKPEEFSPDKDVLGVLGYAALESWISLGNETPFTIFGDYIHNADSVVLRPITATSTRENYDLRELVAENAAKEGLEVRPAWGRHITVNRVTEAIPPQDLGNFIKLMRTNLGFPNASSDGDPIFAESLNVGYFTLSKKGFLLNSAYEFSLKD